MKQRVVLLSMFVAGQLAPALWAQTSAKAPAERLDGRPVVSAKSWAVADGKTGKMLGGNRAAEPRAIASTTKIMTAFLILKLANDDASVLDETVRYSARAAETTGSSAKVRAGEQLPVRELLYGLLLPSGNDAAVAFAEHFGPKFPIGDSGNDPQKRFVEAMNRQAKELKLHETNYLDPHGLAKNQSSARDLAALARQALQDRRFREYVQTRHHEGEVTTPQGPKRTIVWDNTNKLLEMEGYDGVKTGTTTAAGACLVATGVHNGDRLIVVVLGSTSGDGRYIDARNLFRWAWRERGQRDEK